MAYDQQLADAVREVEALREALAFYADEDGYEWRKVTEDDDASDWTAEDREMYESTTVHLDGGRKAREALALPHGPHVVDNTVTINVEVDKMALENAVQVSGRGYARGAGCR